MILQAPPELAAAAQEIRGFPPEALRAGMRLTGLEAPGPPIVVVLAPEGSPAARSAPPWISGWADGELGVVVLVPSRVLRYPDDSLQSLLQHEVAHVLIARAARRQPVPRWFNEGLAMAASRGRDLEDRTRVLLAVLVDGPGSLDRIDQAFGGGERAVQAAYAFAQDFVQDLLSRHGASASAGILRGVGSGMDFEAAFRRATGESLSDAESVYWSRRTFWNRWVPVLTSSTILWLSITLLALAAMRRRRARDARIHRQWEEQDVLRAPPEEPETEDDLVN